MKIDISSRPIRFAFLVRPEDVNNLLKIFRINTCLWGGMYNLIVPFLTETPSWWSKLTAPNAKDIINGYFDFFEPDFIVEAERGLSENIDFDKNRIIQLDDILIKNWNDEFNNYGLSVLDLYNYYYRTEFQFIHRQKPSIMRVIPSQENMAAFSACAFGGFPEETELDYFAKNYDHIFSADIFHLDDNNLEDIYAPNNFNPLLMGSSKLNVKFQRNLVPTLFVLDATNMIDLIDFWNLRAIQRNVVAIPKHLVPSLSSFCKNFIIDNYPPLLNNSAGWMIHPTAMFSRLISEEESLNLFKQYIEVDMVGANTLQTSYPPIWQHSSFPGLVRPVLISTEKSIDVKLNSKNKTIQFNILTPDFIQDAIYIKNRWANAVNLKDWGHENEIAVIFPDNYRDSTWPNIGLPTQKIISTTEGLIVFSEYIGHEEYWHLMNGIEAFESWFLNKKIKIQYSSSGKSTTQIIRSFENIIYLNCLAYKNIITLLDDISKKERKCMDYKNFKGKVKKAVNDADLDERIFEILVGQNIVELGLEVKCHLCGKMNWYKLNNINIEMICGFCLKTYLFPVVNPQDSENTNWSYRVIGPFSLPKYAEGGYASALSIRFFASIFSKGSIDSTITWSAGMELQFEENNVIESDFLLWHQRRQIDQIYYKTQIVFGEAKSFGNDDSSSFKEKDIIRMKYLGEKFPGCFLVFSKMRDILLEEEIELIKDLAIWGREHNANVIILTGHELFARNTFLNITWKELGGKHAECSQLLDGQLITLADLTQQIYLGLPSICDDLFKARQIKIALASP